MLALVLVAAVCIIRDAQALTSQIVIEIDVAAERVLDARSARRLVALELADVDLPAGAGGLPPALFYRVLGRAGGFVRVELWERGEFHEARVVSGSEGPGQLVARRVALAAAELARDLRQRRIAERRKSLRERAKREAEATAAAARTREGPLALRSALSVARGESLTLFGSGLSAELGLRGPVRLDLGGRLLLGSDQESLARVTWMELTLGVARRFRLAAPLELDMGAFVAPAVVHVAGALAVAGEEGARQTWSTRAGAALRLQPRLSRALRASIGVESSLALRSVGARLADGDEARYRGLFFGGELGLVFTPP